MCVQELLDVMDEVHADFFLHSNEERLCTFCIAAEHFIFAFMQQMLLFITGIGRPGKSHVIKVIVELFKYCGCPDNLLLSTLTNSAAILIEGYMIHTLTLLPGKEETSK